MATNEQYFAAIILSIIATSTFIGTVNLAYNNQMPDLFRSNDIQGQVKWQSTSQTLTGSTTIQEQDYTNASGFDSNTTIIKKGTWVFDAGGFHTVPGGTVAGFLLLLNNLIPNGNVYTVSYQINNSEEHPFYLTPRWQFSDDLTGLGNGFSESDIHVDIDSTGVHVKKYPLNCISLICWDAGDTYFYPYPGAQVTPVGSYTTWTMTLMNNINPAGLSTIGTTSSLTVAKDGITLFTTAVKDENPAYVAYYGGVGSAWTNFTVVKTIANFRYFYGSSMYPTGGLLDPFSGIIQMITGWFQDVISFVGSIAMFLGYSISSDICPIWVTAIVMTPQIAGLGLIVAKLIRGTS